MIMSRACFNNMCFLFKTGAPLETGDEGDLNLAPITADFADSPNLVAADVEIGTEDLLPIVLGCSTLGIDSKDPVSGEFVITMRGRQDEPHDWVQKVQVPTTDIVVYGWALLESPTDLIAFSKLESPIPLFFETQSVRLKDIEFRFPIEMVR